MPQDAHARLTPVGSLLLEGRMGNCPHHRPPPISAPAGDPPLSPGDLCTRAGGRGSPPCPGREEMCGDGDTAPGRPLSPQSNPGLRRQDTRPSGAPGTHVTGCFNTEQSGDNAEKKDSPSPQSPCPEPSPAEPRADGVWRKGPRHSLPDSSKGPGAAGQSRYKFKYPKAIRTGHTGVSVHLDTQVGSGVQESRGQLRANPGHGALSHSPHQTREPTPSPALTRLGDGAQLVPNSLPWTEPGPPPPASPGAAAVTRDTGRGPARRWGAPSASQSAGELAPDLHQHLRQAVEEGDPKREQLAQEKGVQRVLGHVTPERRHAAVEVLAHAPGLATEA